MTKFKRRAFLGGAAAAVAASGGVRRADAATAGKNLLVVQVGGGWDTAYALDPKLESSVVDSPVGTLQEFEGIPILVDETRPNVTAFFERYAGISAVVKGIHIRSIVHPDCMRRALTGATVGVNPDVPAIVGFELGGDLPAPYLALAADSFPGYLAASAVSVGVTKQIAATLDPSQAFPLASGEPMFHASAAEDEAIRRYTTARLERERAVRGAAGYNKARLDDFERSLVSGDRLRDAASDFGNRGLSLSLDQQLALAIDSLQGELCRAVMVADALTPWDTHVNNAIQGPYQDNLFAQLTIALDDLASRPGRRSGATMLDETLVVVLSEMTRTPLLNDDMGKDHWPYATTLIAGGGIQSGRVLGATDDQQVGTAIDLDTGAPANDGDLLIYDNFAAGLIHALDVDSEAYLPGVKPLNGIV